MNNELERLKKSIRKSLVDGEASLALDRLHTLTVKIIREICTKHGISITNENGEKFPLHSLMGRLIKYYSNENHISEFSIVAMKQSISIFDKFNEIRNEMSFAHDNEVLSNEESLYVVNCVINTLNFLNYIETGESPLVSESVVSLNDIYKYICFNDCVSTKEIANNFNISIYEAKDMLMELYAVNGIIGPASLDQDAEDDNCQWSKRR